MDWILKIQFGRAFQWYDLNFLVHNNRDIIIIVIPINFIWLKSNEVEISSFDDGELHISIFWGRNFWTVKRASNSENHLRGLWMRPMTKKLALTYLGQRCGQVLGTLPAVNDLLRFQLEVIQNKINYLHKIYIITLVYKKPQLTST